MDPKPLAKAQQQLEERMSKLEAQSALVKENAMVKKAPVWHLPMAIFATILLTCLVIFLGLIVFGEKINKA